MGFIRGSAPPPPASRVGPLVVVLARSESGVPDDAGGLGVAKEGGAGVEVPPRADEPVGHALGAAPAEDGGQGGAGLLRDDRREGVGRVRGGARQALEAPVVGLREVSGGEREEYDAAGKKTQISSNYLVKWYALHIFLVSKTPHTLSWWTQTHAHCRVSAEATVFNRKTT